MEDNGNDKYIPLQSGTVHYKVRAVSQAHFALLQENPSKNAGYEIIISGYAGPTDTIFKNCIKKYYDTYMYVYEDSSNMLNVDEFKSFWIKWDAEKISVGIEGLPTPFMVTPNNKPLMSDLLLTNVGVCTHGVVGTFKLEDGCEFNTTGNYDYVFIPLNSGFVEFNYKGDKDCFVSLTTAAKDTELMYMFILGGYNNTKSAIEYCQDSQNRKAIVSTPNLLSLKEFRKFLITWSYGTFKAQTGDGSLILEWKSPIINNPLKYFKIWKSPNSTGESNLLRCGFGKIEDQEDGEERKLTDSLSNFSYMWKEESNGKVPHNAFLAGLSPSQQPMYVVRGQFEKAWILGSLKVPDKDVLFDFHGVVSSKHKYQVLIAGEEWSKRANLWIRTDEEKIPMNAVVGGISEICEELYVGRVVNDDGSICIGWVSRSTKGCNFINNLGMVDKNPEYDIMCY